MNANASFGSQLELVAVFDPSIENLQLHVARHHTSFPGLADQSNQSCKAFRVEHVLAGVIRNVYHGRDEGDLLPLSEVVDFAIRSEQHSVAAGISRFDVTGLRTIRRSRNSHRLGAGLCSVRSVSEI